MGGEGTGKGPSDIAFQPRDKKKRSTWAFGGRVPRQEEEQRFLSRKLN